MTTADQDKEYRACRAVNRRKAAMSKADMHKLRDLLENYEENQLRRRNGGIYDTAQKLRLSVETDLQILQRCSEERAQQILEPQ